MAKDAGNENLGKCKICQQSETMSDMEAHVKTHISAGDADTHYILRIDDRGAFWMYIQVYGNALLRTIDKFLRQEWLECCGHMSAFTIHDTSYYSHSGMGKGMNVKLQNILRDGDVFKHEYDFGTTTTLRLSVVSARISPAVVGKRGIQVLAVHDLVKFVCAVCNAPTKYVCNECSSTLCKSCAHGHGCDEDSLIYAVQSPRVGLCAYDSGPATLFREGTSTHYVPGGWYAIE